MQDDNEFEKPRKFRDRSKKRRVDKDVTIHPVHPPYYREHKNWTRVVIDGLGEDDFDPSDEELEPEPEAT